MLVNRKQKVFGRRRCVRELDKIRTQCLGKCASNRQDAAPTEEGESTGVGHGIISGSSPLRLELAQVGLLLAACSIARRRSL